MWKVLFLISLLCSPLQLCDCIGHTALAPPTHTPTQRLFRVQTAHGMATHALDSFRDMVVVRRIAPNIHHFTAVVTACGVARPRPLTETAMALYADMRARGIQPDVVFLGGMDADVDADAGGGGGDGWRWFCPQLLV